MCAISVTCKCFLWSGKIGEMGRRRGGTIVRGIEGRASRQ